MAGFALVLVMDVWEHAFLLDYKPAERPKDVEVFFSNIDWGCCRTAAARIHSGDSWSHAMKTADGAYT